MSSWCFICGRKVDASYRKHKGDKAHKKCLENYLNKLKKDKEKQLNKETS